MHALRWDRHVPVRAGMHACIGELPPVRSSRTASLSTDSPKTMLYSSGGTSSVLNTLSVATGSVALISAPAAGSSQENSSRGHPNLTRDGSAGRGGGCKGMLRMQVLQAWHGLPSRLAALALTCMLVHSLRQPPALERGHVMNRRLDRHHRDAYWGRHKAAVPLTIQHALHEGRRAQVAAPDHVDEDQEVSGEAEEQRGDEGARDGEEAQRAKVAKELPLLQERSRSG